MKILLVVILSFTNLLHQQSQNEDDNILWSRNRKLTWEDFKGVPDEKDHAAARTSCNINSSMSKKRDTISFTIKAVVLKSESWVKFNRKDISGLEHEQLHFDITELSARTLRKKIMEHVFNKKTYEDEFDKLVNENDIYHGKLQDQYDLETKHYLDQVKQKEWNKKIAMELKQLEQYKNTTIKIYVPK